MGAWNGGEHPGAGSKAGCWSQFLHKRGPHLIPQLSCSITVYPLGKTLLNYYCDNDNGRLNTLCWSSAFGPFEAGFRIHVRFIMALVVKSAIKLHNLLG